MDSRTPFFDVALRRAADVLDCKDKKDVCEKSWIEVYSEISHLDGNINNAGVQSAYQGFSLGVQNAVSENLVLGATFGAVKTNYNVETRWTSGHSTGINLGAYGMVMSPKTGLYLKGVMSYGAYSNFESREIWTDSEVGVHGTYNTDLEGGKAELGWQIPMSKFNVAPFAAVQYDTLYQNQYNESDPIWGNRYESFKLITKVYSVGMHVDGNFVFRTGKVFRPSLRAAWLYQPGTERDITVSSLAAPGFTWETIAAPLAKNALLMDVGVTGSLSQNNQLGLRFARVNSVLGRSNMGMLNLNHQF